MLRTASILLLLASAACGSTTEPASHGLTGVIATCPRPVSGPLVCTARCSEVCTGLPSDVTQIAVWTSADPAIVAVIAPGVFQAMGVADTVITAEWQNAQALRPVSIFANTPPLPTYQLDGSVYRKGMTPEAGAISGAVVTVLNGIVAGRQAITGAAIPSLPGFGFFAPAPQVFHLLGLPDDVYRLRATKDGYVTQEQDVTILQGVPLVAFVMDPSP